MKSSILAIACSSRCIPIGKASTRKESTLVLLDIQINGTAFPTAKAVECMITDVLIAAGKLDAPFLNIALLLANF